MLAQIPPNPNGTDLSANLCPVRTYDISPVIYRWGLDDQKKPFSPVGTIEMKPLRLSRPYRTHRWCLYVFIPAMNHWANVECPYGTEHFYSVSA